MEDFSAQSKTSKRNRKITNEQLTADHGKMPPQALDYEEAVLGAVMIEKDALTEVVDILKPESFYKNAHQKIYAAIQGLFQRSEPIDLLTVKTALEKEGQLEIIGGPAYIAQLTSKIASAANIEEHARIISQKYIQRELIRISSEIIRDSFDETSDVFDILDSAEQKLFQVAQGNIRKSHDTMASLIIAAKEQIKKAAESGDGINGIPTGFTRLDKLTSGFKGSELLIIAARPAMGKTALVLSMARNIVLDYKMPVAIFSLEMSALQMVLRMVSNESGLEQEKLKKGNLAQHEWEQLNSKVSALSEAPLYIDDTPGLSVFELRAKARRLKAQHDIQMIVIDYLQLMSAGGKDGGNRQEEISIISRSLKIIAKELDVPVIALSQLSRAVETRGGDKRPQLSDLRESGAIEQDADMVMFIYRPEYYEITEDAEGNSTVGLTEIIVAKHRNGALENVPLRFEGKYGRFVDWEQDSFANYGSNNNSNSEDANPHTTVIKGSRMNDMSSDDLPF
ncbi:MAG: replicative DNA helicase [Flavobacteriales bacterium]|jgi:replicative DNA helicase|tara:strand:- start:8314 stop:9840 length:1527 start_codon:yes stop_codon:yes gene_type:complete